MSKGKLIFLEQDDPEMQKAWNYFPDKQMYNAEYGEVLQYMGTVVARLGETRHAVGGRHEFRHRAVPLTNERKYYSVPLGTEFKKRVKLGEFDGQGITLDSM